MASGAASGNGQSASFAVVTSKSPSGEARLEFLIRSNESVAKVVTPSGDGPAETKFSQVSLPLRRKNESVALLQKLRRRIVVLHTEQVSD